MDLLVIIIEYFTLFLLISIYFLWMEFKAVGKISKKTRNHFIIFFSFPFLSEILFFIYMLFIRGLKAFTELETQWKELMPTVALNNKEVILKTTSNEMVIGNIYFIALIAISLLYIYISYLKDNLVKHKYGTFKEMIEEIKKENKESKKK
jgi:hypothetical protein